MSRVFKSFDTEIAENLTSQESKDKLDQQQQEQQQSPKQTRKTAIKKQTFDELYGEPENFLEIEVSGLINSIEKKLLTT